jgi:hypothetical protein
MSMGAYEVAVKLSLVNMIAPAITSLTGGFDALNKKIANSKGTLSELEVQMARFKRTALLGGAATAVAGVGLKFLFGAPLDEIKKYTLEVSKFQSLGFGDAVTDQASKFAIGMKTMGVSATENMALVTDAMAVFKNLEHAKMAAPIMAAMKMQNQVRYGDQGGARDGKFMDLMKVIEFRGGLKSDAEFKQQANYAQQVINGSRNRVDPTQMLNALKTGGIALTGRSNAAFYLGAEPLIQEFGGLRYGTAANSAYQNLVMGRSTQAARSELMRLGLLDPKMLTLNSMTGSVKSMKPGAFKGAEVLEKEGELALLQKVLLPAFAARGITKDQDVIRELGMIFSQRTASGLFARVYQQRENLQRAQDANANAENIDQGAKSVANTAQAKELELHAKWRDLLLELGITVLPIAIQATQGLIGVVKGLISFTREFPRLTSAMMGLSIALMGLIGVGGTIMLAKAALGSLGLVAKGLGGPGGAITQAAISLTMFGKVIGVLGAAAASYAVGSAIYEAAQGKKGETIGTTLYDLLHPNDNNGMERDNAMARLRRNGAVPPLRAGMEHVTPVVLNLDGRKVGEGVMPHLGKAAGRSMLGSLSFDGRQSLTPPGMSFAR